MTQPTQDTDISSSLASADCLLNSDVTRNLVSEDTVVERDKVNMTEVYQNCTDNRQHKYEESGKDMLCVALFPWITEFNKMVCSSIGRKNYNLLQHMLSIYIQNVSTAMDTHCIKIPDIIKLKHHLSNTLMFFHFYWYDIREHISDQTLYFNKMSVLLSIYIDIELKTCKHSKDPSKMTVKFLSMLYIYLNNSEEHIFRVLLRTKLGTKKYTKIYDSIFAKALTNARRNTETITDMQYVSYLLMFKLWKRTRENSNDKKKIDKIAAMILGPNIPKMNENLLKIIPRPPAGHENETVWLLQPNVFDLKQARDNFLALEDSLCNTVQCGVPCVEDVPDLNTYQKLQMPVHDAHNYQSYSVNCETSDDQTVGQLSSHCFKSTSNNCKATRPTACAHSVKKSSKLKKYKSMPKLKPGEVMFIDLTKEDEPGEGGECKKKKGRMKRKLEWLKVMKERYKMRKQVSGLKLRSKVEIADAHSTENSDNSVDKFLLKCLPISDDKVSESSESCTQFEDQQMQSSNARYVIPLLIRRDNKEMKDFKFVVQHGHCNICNLILKHGELQHNRELCLVKLLSFVTQNVKDPKAILNLIKECKVQEIVSSETSSLQGSGTSGQCDKECQKSPAEVQTIKQELPTSTDNNVTKTDDCPDDIRYQSSCCRSVSNYLQAIEAINKKISIDGSSNFCKRTETNYSLLSGNDAAFTEVKMEAATLTSDADGFEKKPVCDKNIMGMLSDLDKCVDVLHRIAEHIMSVHAEKQRTESSCKTDVCAVSTTVFGDRTTESRVQSFAQNIDLLPCSEKINSQDTYEQKEDLNEVKLEAGLDTKYLQKSACPYIKSESANGIDDFVKPCPAESVLPITENKDCVSKCSTFSSDSKQSLPSENPFRESGENNLRFEETKIKTPRNDIDEFENIDILDSILNGDMIMQDEHEILDDSQSSIMSPIIYDSSENALNCITDFFEHGYASKRPSGMEISGKSLPEGSLGTTGILNSLLDFDLTNVDFPPNDFINSNIQTVDPRFIKKGGEEEIFSTEESHSQPLFVEESVVEDVVSQDRDGSEDNYQNDYVDSSVDVVGFGLNSSKPDVSGFSTSFKNVSASSSEESFSKYMPSSSANGFSADLPLDRSYACQKDDIIRQIQPRNNPTNYFSTDVYPLNVSSHPPQSGLPSQTENALSKQIRTVSPVTRQTSVCNSSLSSTDPRCNVFPISEYRNGKKEIHMDSFGQQEVQKYIQQTYKEKQKRGIKRKMESSQCRMAKGPLKYKSKNKEDDDLDGQNSDEELLVQPSPDNLGLRYSQLTFNPLKLQDTENTSVHYSLHQQNSPHEVCGSKTAYKKLKCRGFQKLRNISQRKQKILLSIRDKVGPDSLLKPDSQEKNSSTKEEVKDVSRVPCRSTAKSHVALPRSRTSLKFSKKNIKTDADVSSANVTRSKRIADLSSNNLSIKQEKKWAVQSIDAQPAKCIKKHVITNSYNNEDSSPKRRKDSKQPAVVGCVAQESRDRRIVSLKTDFVCASRKKIFVNCNRAEDDHAMVPTMDQEEPSLIRFHGNVDA